MTTPQTPTTFHASVSDGPDGQVLRADQYVPKIVLDDRPRVEALDRDAAGMLAELAAEAGMKVDGEPVLDGQDLFVARGEVWVAVDVAGVVPDGVPVMVRRRWSVQVRPCAGDGPAPAPSSPWVPTEVIPAPEDLPADWVEVPDTRDLAAGDDVVLRAYEIPDGPDGPHVLTTTRARVEESTGGFCHYVAEGRSVWATHEGRVADPMYSRCWRAPREHEVVEEQTPSPVDDGVPRRNEFVRRVHIGDSLLEFDPETTMVSVAGAIYLDGHRIARLFDNLFFCRSVAAELGESGSSGEILERVTGWTLRGSSVDGSRLTFMVPAGAVKVEQDGDLVRTWIDGHEVAVPIDAPRLELDGVPPGKPVEVTIFVSEVTVGPRPPAAVFEDRIPTPADLPAGWVEVADTRSLAAGDQVYEVTYRPLGDRTEAPEPREELVTYRGTVRSVDGDGYELVDELRQVLIGQPSQPRIPGGSMDGARIRVWRGPRDGENG